jgi:amidase
VSEDIVGKSATELVADIAGKRLSATEVTRAFLERIARLNPAVNAVCTVNPRALEDAAECDRRLGGGERPRPLEGVPFVVKDVIQTAGLRTTFGSKIHEHLVPGENAVSVARLRAAGAVLVGKTNTPEFAHDVNTTNTIFGTTRNPWNLRTTAGGSSGGTGAAADRSASPPRSAGSRASVRCRAACPSTRRTSAGTRSSRTCTDRWHAASPISG